MDQIKDIIEAAPAALLVLDENGACLKASARFAAMVGVDPQGFGWLDAVEPADRRAAVAAITRSVVLGREGSIRLRISLDRGIELQLAPYGHASAKPVGAVGIATIDVEAPLLADVDDRTDALTGAANRTGVLSHLTTVLREAERSNGPEPASVGLVSLDVDDYERIGAEMGEAVGEELLSAVVGRIRGTVRICDLVGRIEGGRFVVVTEQPDDPAAVEHVAARIVKLFERPFRLHDTSVDVSVSVGVTAGGGGSEADDLLAVAGGGVLAARAAGGGCWRRVDGLRLVR